MISLFLAAQAAAPDLNAWGRFSRRPSWGVGETVEIAADGGHDGVLEYKLRLTRVGARGVSETLWTNSRTCPAVRPLLETLPALPMPRVAPPGVKGSDQDTMMDGTGYALRMPAAFERDAGEVHITSNIGTPLAAWVDGALATLARCWSPVELRVR